MLNDTTEMQQNSETSQCKQPGLTKNFKEKKKEGKSED